MNIDNILESFNEVESHDEHKIKLTTGADIEGLYNTIIPKERGFISQEECQQVLDFLHITHETPRQDLLDLRGDIVKYYTIHGPKLRVESEIEWQKIKQQNPQANFSDYLKNDKFDIFMDQMSAFTAVIDNQILERETDIQEAFLPGYTKLGILIEDNKGGYNILDPNSNEKMLIKNMNSLKELLVKLADNL